MSKNIEVSYKQRGFTLVEVMISIVVAMTILAGLMTTFTSQSSKYQYQNKRIDAVQDLEFGIKFMEDDLRSALIGDETVDILPLPGVDNYSTDVFNFTVWDSSCTGCPSDADSGRTYRAYKYDGVARSLTLDRETSTVSDEELLPNVTFFKVFDDSVTVLTSERSGVYTDMPDRLEQVTINGTTPVPTNGYTILIEIEVDVGYKGGNMFDVRGTPTTTKRVWRYSQVYPLAVVN
ncbi:MAG: prepilin-type N-terminal cleavage/methylation domain-containing protein [Ghiorsea sp.]